MNRLFSYLYNGSSDYVLGRSVRSGKSVCYSDNNRCTYIVGLSRMGKSNLMANLILNDIEKADRSVIVLDPHNSLVRALALKCPPQHAHRVTYFYPVQQKSRIHGLNPIELSSSSNREEFELRANAFMKVIEHTWAINHDRAPIMQNTLETLFRTLLSAYPSYQTSILHMLVLTRQDNVGNLWREKLSEFVRNNPGLSQNWDEWITASRRTVDIESSRQKIKHLATSEIIWRILGQPSSTIRFDEIVANKGILLVALRGLEEEFIKLLGSLILTQILIPIWLRGEGAGYPCNIYADEFYYFHPQSFEKIIDEGGKYRVFCTMSSQSLQKARGEAAAAALRCRNLIVFRTDPEDAPKLRKYFISRSDDGHLDPRVLSKLPKHQAMVSFERDKEAVQARIETLKNTKEENREVARAIWESSLAKGRPVQEIEQYKEVVLNPVAFVVDEQVSQVEASSLAKRPVRQKKKNSKITNARAGQTPLSPSSAEG